MQNLFAKPSMIFNNNTVDARAEQKEHKKIKYSTNVLVGNWFEDRFSDKTDKKAIAPSIYGQSGCTKDTSIYKHDFKATNVPARKAAAEFNAWKQNAFAYKLNSTVANLSLLDNERYLKNMTTHKDVYFRIRTQEAAGKNIADILKRKPKEDLLKSYGNATQFGLRQWKHCEALKESNVPMGISIYKEQYTPKRVNIVRHAKRK